MHTFFGKFKCQTFIHETMAINQYFSFKNITDYDNLEMSFSRLWHMASALLHSSMMRVFVALIYYFKVVRVEFRAKFLFNVHSNGLVIFLIFMILIYSCAIINLLSFFICFVGPRTSLSLLIGVIWRRLWNVTTIIHGAELSVYRIPE